MNVGVGDYVRTKGGVICKVLSVRPQSKYMCNSGHYSVSPERYVLDNKKIISLSKPYIKKTSPNIIDLIEVRRLCEWKKSIRNDRENADSFIIGYRK